MKSGSLYVQLMCATLTLGFSAACLSAQITATDLPVQATTPSPAAAVDPTQPGEPSLTVRNQKALETFEPPVNEEYKLGAGDDITLDVSGRPELAAKETIGPDGMITVNIAGAVHIADLTREEAAQAINDKLSKYYQAPNATVTIDKYSSNRVRVMGYVQHPGEVPFEGQPTLLDAIGRAGFITPTVIANGVSSTIGPGIPETCTIYRGDTTAVQVNLRAMLMEGNHLADMRLRRNDIIFVPEPRHLFVSVLGEVAKPGSIPLAPESTLTSVLAEAGCCNDNGGYNPKIHILQRSSGKDVIVEYKKLLTLQGQTEYTLHPGDVIYVPISTFSKVTGIIQKISPVATMVSIAALVGAG